VGLNPNIPESPSWPASPALGGGFPASPTLEDLGDPTWVEAYRRAGGHVRTLRRAEDAQVTHEIVTTAAQRVGMPTPSFLRRLQDGAKKASAAFEGGVQEYVARREELADIAAPSNPVVPTPTPAAPPPVGREADEVFADLQDKTAAWLDIFCPKVNQCLGGAHDAIARGDEESLAQGALSLRRALIALADHVEPPGENERPDHTGKLRPVGREQFKNRLYIYLGRSTRSGDHRTLTMAELERIDAQLSPFVRAVAKGLHAESTKDDLAQLYTTSWSVIAQVVRCAESAS
jgi:hypothetical protein